MKKYDLHIHSKFSDGDYTLEEIIKRIRECGISIFSITDHDNIDSINAMRQIDKKGLIYIPGVELSCNKCGYDMHILGYGIDGNNKDLIQMCKSIKLRKNLRNLEVIQQLKEKFGIVISREETLKLLGEKSFVGQTTIARLLVNNGIIPNIKYYFDNFFPHIKPKTRATIELEEAVKLIHGAGGYAILAHPISLEKTYGIRINEIFNIFMEAGIDGIEIFNSKHSLSDIKRYYKIAMQEGLLVSGGSDFHGEIMKPNVKLGKVSTDGTEEKEHYCMTVITKLIKERPNLFYDIDEEDLDIEQEEGQEH